MKTVLKNSNQNIKDVQLTVTYDPYDESVEFDKLIAKQVEDWMSYKKQSDTIFNEKLDTLGDLNGRPALRELLTNVKCLPETSGSVPKKQIFNRRLQDLSSSQTGLQLSQHTFLPR